MTADTTGGLGAQVSAERDYWLPVGLGLHAVLLIVGILIHSPTRDEMVHLAKGMYMWRTGWFGTYIGNPPLCDLVATVPLIMSCPQLPIELNGHYLDIDSYRAEPALHWRAIVLSRLMLVPFSLLGAFICYRWGRDLGGRFAGRVGLILWCLCPNILAYGQVVTGDLICAATGILAGYALWRWLDRPNMLDAAVSGITVGTAMLAKMIWAVWFALVPLLWLIWICSQRPPSRSVVNGMIQLLLLVTVVILCVNVGYAFEDTCQPLPNEWRLRVLDQELPASSILRRVPIPLPANYLRGLMDVHRVMTANHASYLRGEWRERGWWYYYLYGIAVKLPLGTLALGFVAAWFFPLALAEMRWRDTWTLLIPAAAIMAVVSLLSGLSHHFRYVLPMFPFAFVWLAVAAAWVRRNVRYGLVMVVLCVTAAGASTLARYPHTMSYFNELAGGPQSGHRHLLDSSIDWGQDLWLLQRWLVEHPEASPLHIAYFGSVAPQMAGVEFTLPPGGPRVRVARRAVANREPLPVPGWYAVSVNLVCGRPSETVDSEGRPVYAEQDKFSYFQLLDPVDRAGYSIWIYHITQRDLELLESNWSSQ